MTRNSTSQQPGNSTSEADGSPGHATSVSLLLSWPPSVLSPNARAHWAARNKAKRAYADEARLVVLDALAQMRARGAETPLRPPVTAQWIVVFPDRRRRDWDNLVASAGLKAAVDQCVLEDLLVDDSADMLSWLAPERWASHPHLPKGGVELRLEEL